jgi:hypothetical protein
LERWRDDGNVDQCLQPPDTGGRAVGWGYPASIVKKMVDAVAGNGW